MLKRLRSKLPGRIRHSKIWEKSSPEAKERLAFDQRLVLKQKKKKRLPSWRQFKYISSFFSAKERAAIMLSFFLIIGGFFTGGYLAFAQFVEEVPAKGGSYREGLIGNPLYINPILASTNDVDLDLVSLIYAGLLRYDKNQELQTDLAESWSLSEDGTIYEITLREGLVWHDGQELTADDIIFTYRAIQEPSVNSPLQPALQNVSIEKIDDRMIRFTLDEPFRPFASLLTVGILPQHLWANLPANNIRLAELNIKPIGSGPWKFEKLEKDKQGNIHAITLLPAAQYHLKKPFLQELVVQFFPDFGTAIEALNNNKIEGISYLPRQLTSSVSQTQKFQTHHLQLPQYTAIFFNRENNSTLASKTVRRALAYSVDKNRLFHDVLDGLGANTDGPLLPGVPGYNEETFAHLFDPVKAQELMSEAEWTAITADQYVALQREKLQEAEDETDEEENDSASLQELLASEDDLFTTDQATYREKDGEILELKLTTVDQPETVRAAELIKNAWQALGIKVSLEIVPVNILLADILPSRDYEALLYGQVINMPADLYPFWHSSQTEYPGLNLADYGNSDVDTWLEEARITTDETKLAELYASVQEQLYEDVPAIFLYSPKYTYLFSSKINGFNIERINIPADRWKALSDWYVKTKHIFNR